MPVVRSEWSSSVRRHHPRGDLDRSRVVAFWIEVVGGACCRLVPHPRVQANQYLFRGCHRPNLHRHRQQCWGKSHAFAFFSVSVVSAASPFAAWDGPLLLCPCSFPLYRRPYSLRMVCGDCPQCWSAQRESDLFWRSCSCLVPAFRDSHWRAKVDHWRSGATDCPLCWNAGFPAIPLARIHYCFCAFFDQYL